MRVIGFDPGSNHTGYAIGEITPEEAMPKLVEASQIEPDKGVYGFLKLYDISKKMYERTKGIDLIVIEAPVRAGAFINYEVDQLIGSFMNFLVGGPETRLMTLPPQTIKKCVTGSGRAKKSEVKKSAKKLYGEVPGVSDHVYDAIASLHCGILYLMDEIDESQKKTIYNKVIEL
jgi:Holliday junction resolvasome RuvABC endonuclease subunit